MAANQALPAAAESLLGSASSPARRTSPAAAAPAGRNDSGGSSDQSTLAGALLLPSPPALGLSCGIRPPFCEAAREGGVAEQDASPIGAAGNQQACQGGSPGHSSASSQHPASAASGGDQRAAPAARAPPAEHGHELEGGRAMASAAAAGLNGTQLSSKPLAAAALHGAMALLMQQQQHGALVTQDSGATSVDVSSMQQQLLHSLATAHLLHSLRGGALLPAPGPAVQAAAAASHAAAMRTGWAQGAPVSALGPATLATWHSSSLAQQQQQGASGLAAAWAAGGAPGIMSAAGHELLMAALGSVPHPHTATRGAVPPGLGLGTTRIGSPAHMEHPHAAARRAAASSRRAAVSAAAANVVGGAGGVAPGGLLAQGSSSPRGGFKRKRALAQEEEVQGEVGAAGARAAQAQPENTAAVGPVDTPAAPSEAPLPADEHKERQEEEGEERGGQGLGQRTNAQQKPTQPEVALAHQAADPEAEAGRPCCSERSGAGDVPPDLHATSAAAQDPAAAPLAPVTPHPARAEDRKAAGEGLEGLAHGGEGGAGGSAGSSTEPDERQDGSGRGSGGMAAELQHARLAAAAAAAMTAGLMPGSGTAVPGALPHPTLLMHLHLQQHAAAIMHAQTVAPRSSGGGGAAGGGVGSVPPAALLAHALAQQQHLHQGMAGLPLHTQAALLAGSGAWTSGLGLAGQGAGAAAAAAAGQGQVPLHLLAALRHLTALGGGGGNGGGASAGMGVALRGLGLGAYPPYLAALAAAAGAPIDPQHHTLLQHLQQQQHALLHAGLAAAQLAPQRRNGLLQSPRAGTNHPLHPPHHQRRDGDSVGRGHDDRHLHGTPPLLPVLPPPVLPLVPPSCKRCRSERSARPAPLPRLRGVLQALGLAAEPAPLGSAGSGHPGRHTMMDGLLAAAALEQQQQQQQGSGGAEAGQGSSMVGAHHHDACGCSPPSDGPTSSGRTPKPAPHSTPAHCAPHSPGQILLLAHPAHHPHVGSRKRQGGGGGGAETGVDTPPPTRHQQPVPRQQPRSNLQRQSSSSKGEEQQAATLKREGDVQVAPGVGRLAKRARGMAAVAAAPGKEPGGQGQKGTGKVAVAVAVASVAAVLPKGSGRRKARPVRAAE